MDYQSKHRLRDGELPRHREQLLQNALMDFTNDSDVLAIYLGGSLAKGNFDTYSDIDLHMIVNPDQKNAFIQQKQARPKKWGEVLYFEDFSAASPVVVVHFDCFVKMDTWYHSPNELESSIWMRGNKALYDPQGLLKRILADSDSMKYSPSAEEVEQWRGKIFAYAHETYRSVMRNEPYYAISNLDKLRWIMARGWYMEMDQWVDSSWGVWSKLEGERSRLEEWQRSLLASWDCTRSPGEIMKKMANIMPEFLRLNKRLSKKTGLDEKEEWCIQIIEMAL